MARTFRRAQRLAALSEINVTPLIDLAFALLIIFMITTPLLEQTISLQLPVETQRPESARDSQRFQNISVDAEGQIFWGERPVSTQELNVLLSGLANRPEPPVLHIRGDARVSYQRVVTVIDLIKSNQLTRISLDTAVE